MSWGYSKGFVLEHDSTLKKKIDCKDCIYYEREDRSCLKRPLYLPVDGYNSWRSCDLFELDPATSHYDEKKTQYEKALLKKAAQAKTVQEKKKANQLASSEKTTASVQDSMHKETKIHSGDYIAEKHGYSLFLYKDEKPKGLTAGFVTIIDKNSTNKKIRVFFDEKTKKAYVNVKAYTPDAIEKVRDIIK